LEQEPQTDGELQLSGEEFAALIRKIEGGDPSALATLYDKTSRLLYGLATRILGERTLAEETLLDIYTHIWKQAASYDPGIMPLEWLMMIARTRSIAMLHWSRQIKKRHVPSSGSMDSIMTVAPEEQKTARSHIGTLIPVQREIMDWIYFSGLSCSEIAQIGNPSGQSERTHASA
jgi:RNA polymerase sigma-70 factor (ECF subfamily)